MKRLAPVLLVLLAACSSPTDESPREEIMLGALSIAGAAPVITFPDTVQAGVPFEVAVRTYGISCFAKNRTELSVVGLRATVLPYDVARGSSTCNDTFAGHDHVATVRFGRAGIATLNVIGQRTLRDRELLLVVRQVVVR